MNYSNKAEDCAALSFEAVRGIVQDIYRQNDMRLSPACQTPLPLHVADQAPQDDSADDKPTFPH